MAENTLTKIFLALILLLVLFYIRQQRYKKRVNELKIDNIRLNTEVELCETKRSLDNVPTADLVRVMQERRLREANKPKRGDNS
jgi:beta-lactamase regulating signal transducer with metallopeptidase domain